jgi:hypothetical protein
MTYFEFVKAGVEILQKVLLVFDFLLVFFLKFVLFRHFNELLESLIPYFVWDFFPKSLEHGN